MKWYKVTLVNGDINSTVAASKKEAKGDFIYSFGRESIQLNTLSCIGKNYTCN